MQHNKNTGSDKMRGFYRGAVEVVSWIFWNSYRMALTTLVVFSGVLLFVCLTADPDTATVRDLLIFMQSPAVWNSSAVIALLWVGTTLLLSPRRVYPRGVAAYALGKASASSRPADNQSNTEG